MLVLIKGAGDLATGVACRLYRAGMTVITTEIEQPTAVRRTVSFAQAVFDGQTEVEGIRAAAVRDVTGLLAALDRGHIPVWISGGRFPQALRPDAVVDAIIAKTNTGTTLQDASVVIGLGPGFRAGVDCHAVIETQRGHDMGRMLLSGSAAPNTGIPGPVCGYGAERVIRAPKDGIWLPLAQIGDRVRQGDPLGQVGRAQALAPFDGMVRGMLAEGIAVRRGMKAGDIDPRCDDHLWHSVSEKAIAIGGGALEAILYFTQGPGSRAWGQAAAVRPFYHGQKGVGAISLG